MDQPLVDQGSQTPATAETKTDATSVRLREIDSAQLFQGEKTIAIRHCGEIYRLLVTRHNRLILQK